MTNDIDIGCASKIDLDGILKLQEENQPEHGGRLSANLSKTLLVTIMRETPIVVARKHRLIIGYLVTSTKKINTKIPIISAMLEAYSGSIDSHVYGPICVKSEERGKGIAQAMFKELQRLIPSREYVLFIRSDNLASLKAHLKMGMHEVADFMFNENSYIVLSFIKSGNQIGS